MPRPTASTCQDKVPRSSSFLDTVPLPSGITCLDKVHWPSARLDTVTRPSACLDTVPRHHTNTCLGKMPRLSACLVTVTRPSACLDTLPHPSAMTCLANLEGYRDWAHPTQREMVRLLARDTTTGPVLFRRQLPPQMLLIDHLLRTSLFPLQHYVQRRGAILEALYRISEGYWFSPSELVMTSLMQFEEKVHRKALVRAESLLLLMPRLLCHVLEHLGFPEEPRIERRVRCPLVLSLERVMTMPVSFLLRQ